MSVRGVCVLFPPRLFQTPLRSSESQSRSSYFSLAGSGYIWPSSWGNCFFSTPKSSENDVDFLLGLLQCVSFTFNLLFSFFMNILFSLVWRGGPCVPRELWAPHVSDRKKEHWYFLQEAVKNPNRSFHIFIFLLNGKERRGAVTWSASDRKSECSR